MRASRVGDCCAALAKDLEIGVPEAVDRLELVAHGEDLGEIGVRNEVDELALQPVRVLELVHHDQPEPQLGRLTDSRVVPEQVARRELQVLEVDGRLATLRRRVLGAEALEQLLQEITIVSGQLLECRKLNLLPGGLERCGARASARERREIDELLGRRAVGRDPERLARIATLRLGRRRVACQCLGLCAKRGHRAVDARALAELEHELAARRAERLVDACQHSAQPVGSIRREESQALGVAVGAERLERPLEGLAAEHRRAGVLELAEPRIETRRERMRAEQTVAEPVDGRDPRAVELTCELRPAPVAQRGADTRSQLAGRLARVRDDEDRFDVDAAVANGAHVALDEDRRLPRARAGRDEDRAFRLDRGELLLVEPGGYLHDRHALATRHIGQRSHHEGQPSPFGSCCTSPSRIRLAFSAARSRADST